MGGEEEVANVGGEEGVAISSLDRKGVAITVMGKKWGYSNRPFSKYQLPLIAMTTDSFLQR